MTQSQLGHVGIWAKDLPLLKSFYSDVISLVVTDEGKDICFLSARPDEEHHELVLVQAKSQNGDGGAFNQISWRVGELADLQTAAAKLRVRGVAIEGTFSHGYALSVYFHDPEGNRGEIYWTTGWHVHQPFKQAIDFDQEPEALLEQARLQLSSSGSEWTGAS